jgi:RNA polymerase sigma-70 factor (ECF subfamily)
MRIPYWRREREFLAEATLPLPIADATAHAIENRALIEMTLNSLSPPLRAALVLRIVEGLDYAEIAEALEIPVGTVRSRLNAARQQFRSLWESVQKEIQDV